MHQLVWSWSGDKSCGIHWRIFQRKTSSLNLRSTVGWLEEMVVAKSQVDWRGSALMAARREPLSTIDLGLAGQRKISQFKAIHPIITGPVSTSNSQKLEFYSLFKQSTIGDVNTERPGIFSIIERKKWDSWKALEGTSKEDAKQRYIDVLLDMFDKIAEELDMDLWLNKECDPCIKTNLALLGKSHN